MSEVIMHDVYLGQIEMQLEAGDTNGDLIRHGDSVLHKGIMDGVYLTDQGAVVIINSQVAMVTGRYIFDKKGRRLNLPMIFELLSKLRAASPR